MTQPRVVVLSFAGCGALDRAPIDMSVCFVRRDTGVVVELARVEACRVDNLAHCFAWLRDADATPITTMVYRSWFEVRGRVRDDPRHDELRARLRDMGVETVLCDERTERVCEDVMAWARPHRHQPHFGTP